jgi:DNA-binding CsgD family transcriptional regulator
MGQNYLMDADYIKMLDFIAQISKVQQDYQQYILYLLDEIFGYKYSTFNSINNNLKNYCANCHNIDKKFTQNYNEYYYKTDIFNPQKSKDLQYNNNVVSIKDIMPTSEYENTEFYSDFIKRQMLYHQLALPIKINNKLSNAIAVYKKKEDGDFTDRDVAILGRLNEYITKHLQINFEYANMQREYQRYSNCFDEIPLGIIILNKTFSIMRYNRTAEVFSGNLQNGNSSYNSLQHFANEMFCQYYDKIITSHTGINFYYKSYKINITSTLSPLAQDDPESAYMIFISKLNEEKGEIAKNNSLLKIYNLTAREGEILELVKDGLSNKEIADKLCISKHTVKAHLENIFNKLQVKNRTGALTKLTNPNMMQL